jgi:uncharacterized protein (TIGR02246 family)
MSDRFHERGAQVLSGAVLLCVLALATPAAAQTPDPEGLATGFAESWNAHDMKAFGNLFTEDADFVNVAGTWWKGRAEIQAKHEAGHALRYKASSLVTSGATVRQLRPDVALVHVRWTLSGAVDAEGKAAPVRQGILQIVGVKQPDGWRIASGQNTNQAPPQ